MHSIYRVKQALFTATAFLALLLSACSLVPTPTITSTPTVAQATSSSTDVPVVTPEPVEELIIWVAPAFAPGEDTEAGRLLAERLEQFTNNHPNVELSIRTKALQGDAGLLNTFLAANLAAPETLPDLITLNQNALATASGEGLLLPVVEWGDAPDAEEWYDFAITGSRINGTFFGMPLAAEADIFAFWSARFEQAPANWELLLEENERFCLPLGDPRGTFTFASYSLMGGPSIEADGSLTLDSGILTSILSFYQAAQEAQLLAPESSTIETTEECWDLLAIDQVSAAVVPLENVLHQVGSSLSGGSIPLQHGPGFSLASTWSLALTTARPERIELAAELAEWLSDPAFLGLWSEALGYLPARAAALSTWEDEQQLALASSLVTLAMVQPSSTILSPFSAAITTAIDDVLDRGLPPASAATDAAQGVLE